MFNKISLDVIKPWQTLGRSVVFRAEIEVRSARAAPCWALLLLKEKKICSLYPQARHCRVCASSGAASSSAVLAVDRTLLFLPLA